jgi:hypothetical protein
MNQNTISNKKSTSLSTLNLYIKSLPEDILRKIYSFGSVNNRIQTRQICQSIIHHHFALKRNIELIEEDVTKWNNIYYDFPDNIENPSSLYSYLSIVISKQRTIKLFNQFIKCYCCNRHRNRRPIKINTDELSYSENYETINNCACRCRQFARKIKLVYNKHNNKIKYKNEEQYLNESSIYKEFIE